MLVGTEISAVLTILEHYPIDILGLNCATGPDLMKPHIKYLSEHSPFVVSCIPNAGLPENVGGHAFYRLTPVELRMSLMHFVEDLGVQVIGGLLWDISGTHSAISRNCQRVEAES